MGEVQGAFVVQTVWAFGRYRCSVYLEFLTMVKNLSRCIETFLADRLLLSGDETLNLISFILYVLSGT